MNIFHATQNHDSLPLVPTWGWGVSSFNSANGETNVVLECGHLGATTLVGLLISGEYQDVLDVEQVVKNTGCYEFSTGPIGGGGFPIKK